MRYKISRSVYTTANLNRPETREYGSHDTEIYERICIELEHIETCNTVLRSIQVFHYTFAKTVFAIFCVYFLLYLLAYSSIDRDDKQIAITNNDQRNALFSKLISILGHIVVTF